jgi:predicted RNA-binding protein with PIN domain
MKRVMSTSRPSFLLVDGNNILHAWDDLREVLRRDRERARLELTHRLTEYRQFTGQRVVLVFDGRSALATEERAAGGIQIIFSNSRQAADGVIESLVRTYAATYDLVVATDDRAVQDVAVGAGAEAISAAALSDRVAAGEIERSRWLDRHRKA